MVLYKLGTTARLGLAVLDPTASGQGAWINANTALSELMSATPQIKDKDLATPPTIVNGEGFIIAASPTGAWAGKATKLAFAINSAWVFVTPWNGLTVYVVDEDKDYKWLTSTWSIKNPTSTVAPIFTWVTKTASFTPSSSEAAFYRIAAAGAVVITLPSAASNAGVTWRFKRTDATGNTVTLNGLLEVSGLALLAGDSIEVSSDGTDWLLV